MLLDDIATYLQTGGVGTVGTDLFKGELPPDPDNCVAIYEYAGQPPFVSVDIDRPGLQVRVRNKGYAQARAKIDQIYLLLHALANTTINGTRYLIVRAVQSPFSMGRDSNNLVELVQNFIIMKER